MYHPTLVISFPGSLISSIPTYSIILKSVPGEYFSTLQITISTHRVKFFFAKLFSRKVFSVYTCQRWDCVCQSLSCVRLFATPLTVAHQASLSVGFHRQEYWSGLLFPSPKNHPDPNIKTESPTSPADSLPSESQGRPIAQGRGFHPQEEGSFGSRM